MFHLDEALPHSMMLRCHCYWGASRSWGAIKATWVFPVLWIGGDFEVDALSWNVEIAPLRGLTTISVYGTGRPKTSKLAAQQWHCPNDTRNRAEKVWGGWDKNAELYWRINDDVLSQTQMLLPNSFLLQKTKWPLEYPHCDMYGFKV